LLTGRPPETERGRDASPVPSFGEHDKTHTQAELLAFLQNLDERFAAVRRAWAAYKDALASRRQGKKGPKTTEAKVLMVERARATRKKRGTMGKRQRKKIRGW
jgi:hypothetical protein